MLNPHKLHQIQIIISSQRPDTERSQIATETHKNQINSIDFELLQSYVSYVVFSLQLNVKEESSSEEDLECSSVDVCSVIPYETMNMRALVVDDEPFNLLAIETMLKLAFDDLGLSRDLLQQNFDFVCGG